MSSPGWFRMVFHNFSKDLAARSYSGESTNVEEASDELWGLITQKSEQQVARALEELFGAKELPIMLVGDIVNRTPVSRIAKFLVNRGLVMEEDPDLLPDRVAGSSSEEGTVPAAERDRYRGGRLIGGPLFREQENDRQAQRDDFRLRHPVPDPFKHTSSQQANLEDAALRAMGHVRRTGPDIVIPPEEL